MLALQKNTNDATIHAAKAGLSADGLPKNNKFRSIESDSVKVRVDVLKAYAALGPVVTSSGSNQGLVNATKAVAAEARDELTIAQLFSDVALAYERGVNATVSRRRHGLIGLGTLLVSPAAGLIYLSANGFHPSSSSTTTGEINGTPFSAQTTTTNYAEIDALRAAQQGAQDKRREILKLYSPEILMAPYTLDPLVGHWIADCRAAGQLPPAPSATP